MKLFINPQLLIKPSEIHGKGIFAGSNFSKEDLLEISPILELGLPLDLLIDKVLKDYVFLNKKAQAGEFGPKTYLGLGYISLYNHQDEPNAKITFDYNSLTATVTAKRDIYQGEEIFISYGPNYFKFRMLFHNLSEEVKKKLFELDGKIQDLEK